MFFPSTAPLFNCSTVLAQGSSHPNSPNSSQNGTFRDVGPVPDPQTATHASQNVQSEGDTPVPDGTFGDIDPNYNLSNHQCRALELALRGLPWSQIAKALGLSRKTLWRWKTQNREFQRALADARHDRFSAAFEQRQTLAYRAVEVLGNFLDNPDDKTRMRAAQLLLQSAARAGDNEPLIESAPTFP